MKVLYFYQYFSTPKGSWGTRVFEFTKDWVKAGHEVTVVTSVYSKSDLKAVKFLETQFFEGIKVKIINVEINNKQPFLKRLMTFFAYAFFASWYALTLKTDLVVASSGPITVGVPGLLAKVFRRKKLVFEVRDLWPEGAIELGVLRKKSIIKLAYWFERTLYKKSSLVVSLSPGMKQYIEKNHGHNNVISVTNAANLTLFGKKEDRPELKGLPKRQYAIYTGNIGEVNNSVWLFEAAKVLKSQGREDIKIVLVGDGQQREMLTERGVKEGVSNFKILGLMPKDELVPLVQNALVSLVPLKGTPVLDTSSPNKFFESLAAGVPVVQNTQGWMKDYLDENEVGFTLDPNNPIELANKLIELMDDPNSIDLMGLKALKVAQRDFDQEILSKKMLQAIEEVHAK